MWVGSPVPHLVGSVPQAVGVHRPAVSAAGNRYLRESVGVWYHPKNIAAVRARAFSTYAIPSDALIGAETRAEVARPLLPACRAHTFSCCCDPSLQGVSLVASVVPYRDGDVH